MSKIETIFKRADNYLKSLNDMLEEDNSNSNYSTEQRKKISEEISDLDVIRREIAAWWISPDKMEQEKDKKLELLIIDNNDGKLTNEAIIKFLTDLFVYHGNDFENFDKSWQNSLDFISKISCNPQLVDLIY